MTAATAHGWFEELRELIELRRNLLIRVTLALAALGVLVALVAPGVLSPTPVVGAAVGLAAVLAGLAAAVGADYGDDIVQGPRHVRSLGSDTVATIAGPDDVAALDALAAALIADGMPGAEGLPRRIGIAPVTRDGTLCADVAAELGVSLATEDLRVVFVDVTDVSAPPGLPEVVGGESKLTDAVEYHPDLLLARLPAGEDLAAALELVPSLAARLPSDIDMALFAFPALSERGVLAAAEATDELLLLARRGASRRVELLASLDAAEVTGVPAAVVLVEQPPPDRVAPAATPAPEAAEHRPAPAQPTEPEPAPEAAASQPAQPAEPQPAHAAEPQPAQPAEPPPAPASSPADETTSEIPPVSEPDQPSPASADEPGPAPAAAPRHHEPETGPGVTVRDDLAPLEPGGDAEELYIAASIHAAARRARRRGDA